MKKARLIFAALLVSAALTACSTSFTAPDDCDPAIEQCTDSTGIKPTGGT